MVNLPYSGHTNPSLGLVRCLVAAGHEVDYIQAESFRERLCAGGGFSRPGGGERRAFCAL